MVGIDTPSGETHGQLGSSARALPQQNKTVTEGAGVEKELIVHGTRAHLI